MRAVRGAFAPRTYHREAETMRFKRLPQFAFTDTPRKRAALRRKQRREREALPLFADQIAAQQPSEDAVMAQRAVQSEQSERIWRRDRAAEWRKARGNIAVMPAKQRAIVRQMWNCAPYPADPSRLLGMLRDVKCGRLDLRKPRFPLSKTDGNGARIADIFAKPDLVVTTDEARQVAHAPDDFALAKRRAAYHQLQAEATRNGTTDQAMQDRVLASSLFLRIGEMEDAR